MWVHTFSASCFDVNLTNANPFANLQNANKWLLVAINNNKLWIVKGSPLPCLKILRDKHIPHEANFCKHIFYLIHFGLCLIVKLKGQSSVSTHEYNGKWYTETGLAYGIELIK